MSYCFVIGLLLGWAGQRYGPGQSSPVHPRYSGRSFRGKVWWGGWHHPAGKAHTPGRGTGPLGKVKQPRNLAIGATAPIFTLRLTILQGERRYSWGYTDEQTGRIHCS